MNNESHEPHQPDGASENPLDAGLDFPDEDGEGENALSCVRHDGWTGQRMAMFCAILAETGIVTDACHAVGMSTTSAYGARRRNLLFAAAWEESLKLARDRLADALLERSLNGCLEKYYKDGELVGEKRLIDNRLAMQVLRRLDQRSEQFSCGGRSLVQRESAAGAARLGPRLRGGTESPDWDLMLSALRTGDEDMVAEALIEAKRIEGNEVGEVCVAGNSGAEGDNFDDDEPDPRCWRDEDEQCWMTDFPPPADFAGYQKGRWGDEEYSRECTREESLALDAALDAELAEERAEDEAERDNWFGQLGAAISGDAAALPESDGEAGGDDRQRDPEPDDRAPPV
jgi:hypothetical protein